MVFFYEKCIMKLGEQPYECNHCARTFAHQKVLKKHIRCHTGHNIVFAIVFSNIIQYLQYKTKIRILEKSED